MEAVAEICRFAFDEGEGALAVMVQMLGSVLLLRVMPKAWNGSAS